MFPPAAASFHVRDPTSRELFGTHVISLLAKVTRMVGIVSPRRDDAPSYAFGAIASDWRRGLDPGLFMFCQAHRPSGTTEHSPLHSEAAGEPKDVCTRRAGYVRFPGDEEFAKFANSRLAGVDGWVG